MPTPQDYARQAKQERRENMQRAKEAHKASRYQLEVKHESGSWQKTGDTAPTAKELGPIAQKFRNAGWEVQITKKAAWS